MGKALSMHSLLEPVREACSVTHVNFKEVKRLLENTVGTDTIIDYYISTGPFPLRKDVLLDIFILSPLCLYNLDIRRSVHLCHRLFLDQVALIEENSERGKEGERYIVHYIYAGTRELIVREKASNRDSAEKFCSKIKDAVIAVRRLKKR
jgi:hypothetical protein